LIRNVFFSIILLLWTLLPAGFGGASPGRGRRGRARQGAALASRAARRPNLPSLRKESRWPRPTGTGRARSRGCLPAGGRAAGRQGGWNGRIGQGCLPEADGSADTARRLHGRCERVGRRGREASRKWRGICCSESERKMCSLVLQRRTNPNKHLLCGLDFLDGLDASNPN